MSSLCCAGARRTGRFVSRISWLLVFWVISSNVSADALNSWTKRPSGFTNDLYSVAYGNGTFVAAGIEGSLFSSMDGLNWTLRPTGTTNAFEGVTFGNGLFVAVGENGSIRTSTDGANWIKRSSGFSSALHAVTYGGGRYIAVGFSGGALSSADGVSWAVGTSPTSSSLHAIVWANGQFVAAGSSGTILTSMDGVSWINRNSGTANALHTIAYGAGRFVTGGFQGVLLKSTDGATWMPIASGTTNSLRGSIFSDSTFVVVGFRGTIISSTNATDWIPRNSGVTNALRGICQNTASLLAVGHEGTILETAAPVAEPAPVASFSASPTNGTGPLMVSFNDSSTGSISSRLWDFGDGSTSDTTATQAIHTYTTAGSFTVSLTVRGPSGINTQTRANYVQITLPGVLSINSTRLDFGIVALGQTKALPLTIVNSGGQPLSGAAVASPPFRIGSGSPFSLAPSQTGTVSIVFAPMQASDFNGSVIFNSDGGSGQTLVFGTGGIQAVAGFSANPTNGTAPLAVTFTDNSTGTITNRLWDFGDGVTMTTEGATAAHAYSTVGTYTVTLTVMGPMGANTLSHQNYIKVATSEPIFLTLQSVGNQIQLSWQSGILESSANPAGPYSELSNARSPWLLDLSNQAEFFRVKVR